MTEQSKRCILLIRCGGTIGSVSVETKTGPVRTSSKTAHDSNSTSGEGLTFLEENFRKSDSPFRNEEEVSFETKEDFGFMSENMTVEKWNTLINYLKDFGNSFSNYSGIIITHGTDTLAYSSALFSLLLRNIGIPVIFVSSNDTLKLANQVDDNPKANGYINFQKAVECICEGIKPNVYVVYQNDASKEPDDAMNKQRHIFLHLASRIKQCENYSENFYSQGSIDLTELSDISEYGRLFDDIEIDKTEEIVLSNCQAISNCVLIIKPYVGLDYNAYNLKKYHAILHGTYHSGTVCVNDLEENKKPGVLPDKYGTNSILHLLSCLTEEHENEKEKVDLIIHPFANDYDSSRILAESWRQVDPSANKMNLYFLRGCTTEMAYVKLLLAYANKVCDIDAFIHREFNGEMVY